MRLIANWRAVLRYVWTVRLALHAAVLNGIAIALSIITGSLPVAGRRYCVARLHKTPSRDTKGDSDMVYLPNGLPVKFQR